MNIIYLKTVGSTHSYLKDYINKNGYKKPTAVVTQNQTAGIGSRDNHWDGKKGNLFFSFVLKKDKLPEDLFLQSASIYFSFILKDILSALGSKVWLKWPNDFYINDKKIGGTITNVKGDYIYCGIGLNLVEFNNVFGNLDIDINIEKIMNEYFKILERTPTWKQIFIKFEVEFHKNDNFRTNIEDSKVLLKNTILQDDGSILVDDKKVYSLR